MFAVAGDWHAKMADKIEWLLFNAGRGSHHPEESAIAYLKSDNSYSMKSVFQVPQPHCFCEKQTRYKYSPVHQDVAICCVPNAGRIMPDVIGHVLGRMGCQLLLSPSSWAVSDEFIKAGKKYGEEWTIPYEMLSKMYKMPIVGVSNVGEVPFGAWKGWHCIGNSIATNSKGEVVKVLPFGVHAEVLEIIELELVKNELQGTALAQNISEWKNKMTSLS